jgi:parvulin-like peptidyl-prolyl isomerase
MTWQQYFLESALSSWSRYAALNMQGKEEGFQMSQEVQDYLESVPAQLDQMAISGGYESADAMLQEDMSYACDMEGYMDFMQTNLYAGQYLEAVYDTILPTDQEVADYYAANEAALNQQGIVNDGSVTVDARHILICPEDTESEESWEQCRVKAQELLDKWLAEDGTEEGFAKFAAEHTEDPGSMATGGLYTDIYMGQMVAPFEEWCFDTSRQYGDTGLVKTDYGYHIMYFVASHEIWVANVRDTMVYERSLAIVNGAVEKWPMEVNLKKVVLGTTLSAE